jgi:hypothetical protein
MGKRHIASTGALTACGLALLLSLSSSLAQDAHGLHRVYSHLLEPREHPDYDRRAVKPPNWDTFKNRTQFTCLRGFSVENDRVTTAKNWRSSLVRTNWVT